MKMLEKIARAIEDAMASDDNHPHDIARAALLAMRDLPPSVAEEAAKNVFGASPLPHEVGNFDGGWTAAIDSILDDGDA